MSSFTVTVKNDDVKQALAALQQRLNNMQPAMQGIGETIMERAKRRFDTSTAPDGTPWQPLNTRGRKAMGARKPLVDTGRLSEQFFVSADQNSVSVSNSMAYAAIHQFGGMAGRNRKVSIPARPFLPVSASGDLDATERDQVLQVIADYLTNP